MYIVKIFALYSTQPYVLMSCNNTLHSIVYVRTYIRTYIVPYSTQKFDGTRLWQMMPMYLKLQRAKLWQIDCRFHRKNIKREKFNSKNLDELLVIHQICQTSPFSNLCIIWYVAGYSVHMHNYIYMQNSYT